LVPVAPRSSSRGADVDVSSREWSRGVHVVSSRERSAAGGTRVGRETFVRRGGSIARCVSHTTSATKKPSHTTSRDGTEGAARRGGQAGLLTSQRSTRSARAT
jgi:hypothetical protein